MTKHRKEHDLPLVERDAEEAARFYAATFPDRRVGAVHLAPGDFPFRPARRCPDGRIHRPGHSLPGAQRWGRCRAQCGVLVPDRHRGPGRNRSLLERDRRQRRPGERCGWCKDKWGISWQITPVALTRANTSSDRAAAKRAFEAMMTMRKIDIATIEAAVRG